MVYVFRTPHVGAVVEELRGRGWTLTPEKHGDGPEHYSITLKDDVVEIYPAMRERPCDRCLDQHPGLVTICRKCLDELLRC